MSTQQQRAEFVVLAQDPTVNFSRLCQEYEISRPTGYLWLQRYREQGVTALQDRSRRPMCSPTRTESAVEELIVSLRRERPDWGARKLWKQLRDREISLPIATIHRVLLRHGLVSDKARVQRACQRFERDTPNELWQMDFKGQRGWEHPIGPLSVLDDCSRYLIALEGTWTTKAEPVQERLQTAFVRCGVPEAMLMDHGTPWWNSHAPRGWSKLLLWIMRQGIRCHFSGYRHPQTQGKVERFHGTLDRARHLRAIPPRALDQPWLDEFRYEYNHIRPHEALQMRTPAEVWHPSPRKYDPHPSRWEYAPGAEVRKLGAQGKLTVDGYRWSITKALAGEWVELKRAEGRILVYYCNSLLRELDPAAQRSTAVERWANPHLAKQKV